MSKKELYQRLKMFTQLGEFRFYCSIGSDEYTHTGWQRRTSEFILFVVFNTGKIQLEYFRTGKDVHQLKESIIEKYTKWINAYIQGGKQ